MLAPILLTLALAASPAPDRPVLLATTTSFQDSGLLDALTDRFRAAGGPRVKAVAVGTGEALALGARGEADVLVVHAPEAEEAFMAAGHGSRRLALWYNDFVVVGPKSDPAKVAGAASVVGALRTLALSGARWASRGDRSGTHKKEKQLLQLAGVQPWKGFLSVGQGMGDTLRVASEKQAYTLADRSTWLKLAPTLDLKIVVEGDPPLWNPYHVIEVAPSAHPSVNAAGARRFADFLVFAETQRFVAGFGKERFGRPLFTPGALPVEPPVPGVEDRGAAPGR